jgi:CheY-like chemotaxis protein
MEDRSPVLKAARHIEIWSLAREWPVEAQMTSSRSKYNYDQKIILCVDDEPLVLASWAELIASAGYRVLTARGGVEALRQFSTQAVDAVVLDYEMPGMNGGTVGAQIRRINNEVPIILHSGGVTPRAEELALFDIFVSKAEKLSVMLTALESALTSRVSG